MPSKIEDLDKLLGQINSEGPDIVEFRLDRLDVPSVEVLARKKTSPAIATDKSNRPLAARRKLLLAAIGSGFEFVDVDVSSPETKELVKECETTGTRTIVSTHDLRGTPPQAELSKKFNSIQRIGADICKIVTTATQSRDNLEVLNFVQDKCKGARLVSFAMGSLGIPSRILSPVFGAEFTFASLDQNTRTADGQLSIDDLRNAWRLLGIQ